MKQIYFPQTVFPAIVPASEYAELVVQIPAGYVTTSKEIEQILAHRNDAERVEYDGLLPKFFNPATGKVSLLREEGAEQISFYRVLSERGFVQETRSYSKELAVEMLRQEGHEVLPSGKGYWVEGYRAKLFDLRGALEVNGVVE
ncbi:MAG: hypothetical protein IJI45_03390 [Anaerolineaceae bacterium]|nr:hypothetical protein [Anaerolineaceae bacterium]